MNSFPAHRLVLNGLLTTCLIAISAGAGAQQVIRIVGSDGRVTYADRMPNQTDASEKASNANISNTGDSQANLPYELKQVANRFPVTIYTSKSCGPCDSARTLLKNRGVPYTEKTVTSNEDIAALERISGSGTLPFATVGQQHVSGFSASEWVRYLDVAGYPSKSQLPANYQPAPATPLVASATKPTESSTATTTNKDKATANNSRRTVTPPSGPTVNRVTPKNPAGIQF